MKRVTVTAKPDGSVTVEGEGFVGTECDQVLGQVEQHLGSVKSRENKPEYFQGNAWNASPQHKSQA